MGHGVGEVVWCCWSVGEWGVRLAEFGVGYCRERERDGDIYIPDFFFSFPGSLPFKTRRKRLLGRLYDIRPSSPASFAIRQLVRRADMHMKPPRSPPHRLITSAHSTPSWKSPQPTHLRPSPAICPPAPRWGFVRLERERGGCACGVGGGGPGGFGRSDVGLAAGEEG